MSGFTELPRASLVFLYGLLALITFVACVVAWAQVGILKGRPFKNPDGTSDDWRDQKIFYGIAWADLTVAIPLSFVALVLVFASPERGLLLLTGVAVWLLWSNVMTTVTSLRFARPKITLAWLVVFPFGAAVGAAYLLWIAIHFEAIYGVSFPI